VTVRSQVDKPNRARPTKGPRPERLIGGAVAIALRIEDRAGGVKLLEEAFTVTADGLPALPADRRDAYVTALVDKANAEVSARIFFALQPPVVLRKWVGEGGAWHVEVRMSERVARSYRSFAAGVEGSLASPDWRHLAAATWVGGGAETSTFRLTSDVDAASLKAGVTQVRPVQ
jgi:hypothetical protein